jgi:outer membrane protein assembly factor BamB
MHLARWALLASACGLLLGCQPLHLHSAPFGARTGAPPVALFEVDWWTELVPSTLWEYLPREPASPASDKDHARVVALTRDGAVRSLGAGGKVAWSYATGGKFNAAPLVQEGVVYVPGGDGTLYALDATAGKLLWKYEAKEELATTPVVADGKVLVASQSDALFVVEQKTGKWLWQYRRDTPSGFTIRGVSRPTVSGGVAFLGFSDGQLVALRVLDGTVKWERSLSSAGQFVDVDTTPVIDDSGWLFAASYKDGVYALDADTGDVKWHTVTQGVTQLTLSGEALFASGDQQVAALAGANGRWLWTLPIKGTAGRTPVLARGLLLVPTQGELLFIDPLTGRQRAAWDPGQGVSAPPLWTGSALYVLSNGGYLYAMRLQGKSG